MEDLRAAKETHRNQRNAALLLRETPQERTACANRQATLQSNSDEFWECGLYFSSEKLLGKSQPAEATEAGKLRNTLFLLSFGNLQIGTFHVLIPSMQTKLIVDNRGFMRLLYGFES